MYVYIYHVSAPAVISFIHEQKVADGAIKPCSFVAPGIQGPKQLHLGPLQIRRCLAMFSETYLLQHVDGETSMSWIPFLSFMGLLCHSIRRAFQRAFAFSFPHPLRFSDTGRWSFFGTQSVTDQNMHAVNDIAMSMKSFARVLQVLPGSSVMQETQLSSMKTNFMQQALQMRGKLKRCSSWSWLSAELHRVQRMNNDEQWIFLCKSEYDILRYIYIWFKEL